MTPLRVLVVDDHADSAEMLAQLLRRDGHHVAVAHSVAGALVAWAHDPAVELLVSDISLPDGKGSDLLRMLKKRSDGGPRFAIALTGFGEEDWLEECRRAGYQKLLLKPVLVELLRSTIAGLATSHPPAQTPADSPPPD
jgi:CheY-like chemotaxis protein